MVDSDRTSTSLCHEADAAFAFTRFAYSIGRSLSKFRPVVRTGSVSLGRARGLPESPFMPLDLAIVPCSRRNVFVVWRALSNAIIRTKVFLHEDRSVARFRVCLISHHPRHGSQRGVRPTKCRITRRPIYLGCVRNNSALLRADSKCAALQFI